MEAKDLVSTYRNIGDENAVYSRIIQPAVNEVLKASSAKRTARSNSDTLSSQHPSRSACDCKSERLSLMVGIPI